MSRRIKGYLYDADSGVCMGLGSYEMIAAHGYNSVFNQTFSGCPHKVIIYGYYQP